MHGETAEFQRGVAPPRRRCPSPSKRSRARLGRRRLMVVGHGCTTMYDDGVSTSITVSKARAALPQILERVLAGEEVTITRHGRAVAVVVRPDALRARRAS